MKTRTKEEILKECGFGTLKEVPDSIIRYCRIEIEIDKRDLLEEIRGELKEMNRLRKL